MKIKVCGLANLDNLIEVVKLQPDFVGLNFYKNSKRYCNFSLPADFNYATAEAVGVFVDSSIPDILGKCQEYKLSYVQLHGDETLNFCEKLKAELAKAKIIKVFRISDHVPDLTEWNQIADYFLFDTDSKMYGGSGKKFNWNLLQSLDCNRNWFLAGGIDSQDLDQIKKLAEKQKNFFAVDINSKFETDIGIKDLNLVGNFIRELRK